MCENGSCMAKAKPVVNSLLVSVPVLVAALTMRPSAVLAGGATLPQSLAPTQMREDTGAAAMPKLAVDKLWFSANSDVLAATNEQLLDAIAAELVAHPEYERVAIAGHASPKTDSGNERVRWNLALRRARQTVWISSITSTMPCSSQIFLSARRNSGGAA